MARGHPNRCWSGWRAALRRRATVLLLAVGLVGLLAVAVAAGWVGWLVNHKRWFAASTLGVFVAAVSLVVAVVMPRWQQRRVEQLAAAQQAWQERREQEQLARQREEAAAAEQATWVRRYRELLTRWPLPGVEEVNPYDIGVFYSRRADAYRGQRPRPPYVPRAVDRQLAELLRVQPLVLVKGQSRAGKSRTAFEVAAQELSGWRLLIPKDRAALAGLGDLLVWLDDLDEYLATEGTRGLDAGLLARLAACDPPVKVLATIRLEEHGLLAATPGELGRSVRELLNRFDPGAITLPVGFDEPAERAAITELYPGEQVSGGLAEHLAAAHELVDRLEAGEARAPEGAGLVLAAVDCRRAELDRPVSRAELAELLPIYLKRLRPLVPVVREGDVDRGLGWATEPVGRTAALLVADPDPLAGTFQAANPIVDYVERRTERRLVDPAVWERLLGLVSPKEAVVVGFAAHARGERRAAETAWRRVIDSGHPDAAPAAAVNLGLLLTEQGDVAGARAAYQRAIDSRHPAFTFMAGNNLGHLLAKQGDVAGARTALQQVIDSGHPTFAPAAVVNLGLLLTEQGEAEQGDVVGARAAFQQAIDSGHSTFAPTAARNLGNLLEEQGDAAGARAAYQQAIDSGHPDEAPRAAADLGHLLAEQGDVTAARAAYQRAIDSGHPEATTRARQALRALGLRDRQT